MTTSDREIKMKTFRDSPFFEPYKKVAFRGEYAWWSCAANHGRKCRTS